MTIETTITKTNQKERKKNVLKCLFLEYYVVPTPRISTLFSVSVLFLLFPLFYSEWPLFISCARLYLFSVCAGAIVLWCIAAPDYCGVLLCPPHWSAAIETLLTEEMKQTHIYSNSFLLFFFHLFRGFLPPRMGFFFLLLYI